MSKDIFDVDALAGVDQVDNKAVPIAFDIKDCQVSDCFGLGINRLYLNQVLPVRFTCNPVPVIEGITRVRMTPAELPQDFTTNNAQVVFLCTLMFSKREHMVKSTKDWACQLVDLYLVVNPIVQVVESYSRYLGLYVLQ